MGRGMVKVDVTRSTAVKKCHKNVTGKKQEKNCHTAGSRLNQ